MENRQENLHEKRLAEVLRKHDMSTYVRLVLSETVGTENEGI